MKRFIMVSILALCTIVYPAACLAQDGISVHIVAGADKASSSVTASGQVSHIITDKERTSFNIHDNNLKDAVDQYYGKRPHDAYLHSPTPWDDLYKRFYWPEVQTVLRVRRAEIVSISSAPTIIATRTFTNNSKTKSATFNTSISEQVTDTSTSSWSETSKIEINQKFSYGVTVQGETTLNYQHTWGHSGSETKTTTVGSTEGLTVELDPGESVVAHLSASKGTMKVRITYDASLTGDVAVNYNPTYKGHHFWGLGINGVMQAHGLPSTMSFTEDIEVGYYSNAKVELVDSKGTLRHSGPAIFKR